jgi:hypothetical protein
MGKENLVEKFNEMFPPGSTVRWRSIGKENVPFREYTVLYAAADHNGTPVAWFKERTEMCSVEPAFVDYSGGDQ